MNWSDLGYFSADDTTPSRLVRQYVMVLEVMRDFPGNSFGSRWYDHDAFVQLYDR